VDILKTAYIVKLQHKKLRANFLKEKNAKLIWKQESGAKFSKR